MEERQGRSGGRQTVGWIMARAADQLSTPSSTTNLVYSGRRTRNL